MRPQPQQTQQGFTLLEILVALVLIGLLAGALVPSVLNQLSKGERNRVVEDLDAVAEAAKLFRVDVNRWPRAMDQLVTSLSDTATDLDGSAIPAGLRQKWGGPYVDMGLIKGDSLPTALGGVIQGDFSVAPWNGTDFLTLHVAHVTRADAEAISEAVDGDAVVVAGAAPDDAGRVRWVDATPDRLEYLAVPVN